MNVLTSHKLPVLYRYIVYTPSHSCLQFTGEFSLFWQHISLYDTYVEGGTERRNTFIWHCLVSDDTCDKVDWQCMHAYRERMYDYNANSLEVFHHKKYTLIKLCKTETPTDRNDMMCFTSSIYWCLFLTLCCEICKIIVWLTRSRYCPWWIRC